jgi:hypothetical protein
MGCNQGNTHKVVPTEDRPPAQTAVPTGEQLVIQEVPRASDLRLSPRPKKSSESSGDMKKSNSMRGSLNSSHSMRSMSFRTTPLTATFGIDDLIKNGERAFHESADVTSPKIVSFYL